LSKAGRPGRPGGAHQHGACGAGGVRIASRARRCCRAGWILVALGTRWSMPYLSTSRSRARPSRLCSRRPIRARATPLVSPSRPQPMAEVIGMT